jgi:hypothetical protein
MDLRQSIEKAKKMRELFPAAAPCSNPPSSWASSSTATRPRKRITIITAHIERKSEPQRREVREERLHSFWFVREGSTNQNQLAFGELRGKDYRSPMDAMLLDVAPITYPTGCKVVFSLITGH